MNERKEHKTLFIDNSNFLIIMISVNVAFAASKRQSDIGILPPDSVQQRLENGMYDVAILQTSDGQWLQDASTGKWRYKHADNSYTKNDWEQIGNRWYHFDKNGWMQTGWFQDVDSKWYYLHITEGYMMVKWVQVNTDWYYMDEHGVMVTGWLTIDDVKYYFAADGKMLIEEGDPINLSLKAIPDRYINEEYSQEYVIETLDKIQTPYEYVWNITFDIAEDRTAYNFPNIQCSYSRELYCGDAIDSLCENSLDTPYHHRNANKNLNYLSKNVPANGNDIKIALTATPLCGMWDKEHATNILGVTYNKQPNSYITWLPSSSQNVHVRIVQHELSHMFGAHDASCSQNQPCVMK